MVLKINSFCNQSAKQQINGTIVPNLFGYFYLTKSFTHFPGEQCQFVELVKPNKKFDEISTPDIFGIYVQIPATVRQHQLYISEDGKWAIWWDGQSKWWSGPFEKLGNAAGSAYYLGEDLPTQLSEFKSADFTNSNQQSPGDPPTFKLQCKPKWRLDS